ncbi:MAG: SGNH/GDSL hydrolase family protein [Lachnospiraceae bacterium]|nr:SGNH/GDSL hydrolase family protein [Lachnospiraceae bacterium]
MILSKHDRIVFAGDSVTDMGSVNPVGEGFMEELGRSYVHVVDALLSAVYPDLYIQVTNSGVSGNNSRDLLNRFDRDVLNLNPDWISICIGINDVWRQFDCPSIPHRHVSLEEYERNMESMISRAVEKAKGVFVMTPYYMEPNPADTMRARMEEYCDVCRRLAKKYGATLIDLQKIFADYCTVRHSTYVAWDRVHPNQTGATLIALAFLKEIGFEIGF